MKVLALFVALVSVSMALASVERVQIYDRDVIPDQWMPLDIASGASPVEFTIALYQRNLDKLEAKFWAVSDPDSPDYQNFLTNHEVMDIIESTPEHRDIVMNFLTLSGVTDVEDRRDAMFVRTTVAVASKMFGTKFMQFQHRQRASAIIIRQVGPYTLPAEVAEVVHMVSGISDFPPIARRARRPGAPADTVGVIPATLQNIYNIPSTATGENTSQGVAEFGAGEYFSQSDLQSFAVQTGTTIKKLTSDHIINAEPPVGVEGTLDIQYVAGIGAKSVNWYWTDNTWMLDFANKFFAATDKPEVISMSYGWSELQQCQLTNECSVLGIDSEQFVARVNTEFMKIGTTGVSLFSASGDSGANGRTDPDCTADQLYPAFPGASPYVTAVGATQLTNAKTNLPNPPPACQGFYSCASSGDESAVSYDVSQFTSGGGFSNYAPMPDYQKSAVTSYLNSGVALPPSSYYNATNRGFPDVASIGHNILIYEGGIEPVGGTSCSSPSWAGYASLLNNVAKAKTGKSLGFLNPLLYKMFADQPDTFRDITKGDNKCTEGGCSASCKGYMCAAGWDPVTGLGVPNVDKMIAYVSSMLDARAARQ